MTYLSPKNNPFIGNVADLPAKAWLGHEPSKDPLQDILATSHICHDDRDGYDSSTEAAGPGNGWTAATSEDYWQIFGIPAGVWLAIIVIGACAVRYWGGAR